MTDGGSSIPAVQALLPLVEPGGMFVKDDLTPERAVDVDPVREFLLGDPRLVGVEIIGSERSFERPRDPA